MEFIFFFHKYIHTQEYRTSIRKIFGLQFDEMCSYILLDWNNA